MIWFDSIFDLQYYKQPKGVPCYCELIVYPSDMFLQGLLPSGNGNYSLKIYVYSADGLTQYEDATSYFSYYFGRMPGGQHFFNARLKAFSPSMCAYACYILRAEVVQNSGSVGQVLFNKYTERYCQNNCCDVARDISFDQDGFSQGGGDVEDVPIDDIDLPGDGPIGIPTVPAASLPTGMCGEPLIRLISKFDCIDKFTGDFFGLPDVVFGGTANFSYRKITTFKGRVVRRPRDIDREMSYNCKLLRAESTALYLLEGFEYFPPWKMYELEGQLHANNIYIDDFKTIRRYEFAGGKPMKQIHECFELFKLETELQDCTQRQIFGCEADCKTHVNPDGSALMFAIPASYTGGAFYNENKELVAYDYDGLMTYFHSQEGVTDVQDADISTLTCNLHKVVSITGSGYLPGSIYYDSTIATKRVYGQRVDTLEELCSNAVPVCAQPAGGTITIEEAICTTPVADEFYNEDIGVEDVTIIGYENWIENSALTATSVYRNEVTFSLEVNNTTIAEDPDDPTEPVLIAGLVIGVMGSAGRPQGIISISSDQYAGMPADSYLTIDEYGIITYTGEVSAQSDTDVTITLSNLKYNI